VHVGVAEPERAGDLVRGEVTAVAKAENVAFSRVEALQPALDGIHGQPVLEAVVRRGEVDDERRMLVERRAGTVALSPEVIAEDVASDHEDPGRHRGPRRVEASPRPHDALEGGGGQLLRGIGVHRIPEERVHGRDVAAIHVVQRVPFL
jgi:hypothetical protein